MNIELILNVPESVQIDPIATPQLHDAIKSVGGVWTGDPQPGTRTHDGRKLIVARSRSDVAAVETMIESLSLDWQIVGAREPDGTVIVQPAEADVIDFMPDVPVYDEQGEITGYERPAEARLGHYAGAPPWSFS